MAFYSAFWGQAFWNQAFQIARGGSTPPTPTPVGSSQGAPVGWGTSGRRSNVPGHRSDDIKVERRKSDKLSKLRIQEIDNHDIMLFVKTFRNLTQ